MKKICFNFFKILSFKILIQKEALTCYKALIEVIEEKDKYRQKLALLQKVTTMTMES